MSDLVGRLRIKAGMIEMGELIAWGSDSALMREAADALEENAKLRAELGRRVPDGWSVTEDGNSIIVRPDGRMAVELSKGGRPGERVMWEFMRAMLSAAQSAPKADDPVKVKMLEALESAADALARAEFFEQADNARAAISAVREEVMK